MYNIVLQMTWTHNGKWAPVPWHLPTHHRPGSGWPDWRTPEVLQHIWISKKRWRKSVDPIRSTHLYTYTYIYEYVICTYIYIFILCDIHAVDWGPVHVRAEGMFTKTVYNYHYIKIMAKSCLPIGAGMCRGSASNRVWQGYARLLYCMVTGFGIFILPYFIGRMWDLSIDTEECGTLLGMFDNIKTWTHCACSWKNTEYSKWENFII